MAIKYFKLLDVLNKRGISKGELRNMCGLSSTTIAKFARGEYVSLDVIDKICSALGVQPGEIMEYVEEE
jgi:DNA-binding Xre family transcriptional regulator